MRKKLREIVYNTLTKHHGVSPHLLSRIDNEDPVVIELKSGSEIVIEFEKDQLNNYINIPLKSSHQLLKNSNKFLEKIMSDTPCLVSFKEDQLFLLFELEINDRDIEKNLSDKLESLNQISNLLNGDNKSVKKYR